MLEFFKKEDNNDKRIDNIIDIGDFHIILR